MSGVSGNNVVGEYFDGFDYYGFLYDNGTYTTIAPYGGPGTDTTLPGIHGNNIVGYYDDVNSVFHGFEDTISVVPEPSSFVLLGIAGLVGFVVYRFRRKVVTA